MQNNKGLSNQEVIDRQTKFGPNELTQSKGKNPIILFLEQFKDPMIYILIGAFIIMLFLHDYLEATIILLIILLNTILGFIQEAKALKAINALSQSMKIEATVIRDGIKKQISASDLVPGDIVILQSGDKVPADIKLLKVKELQIDESTLTGESAPIEKNTTPLPKDTQLADKKNMAFSSTLITHGTGVGEVVNIGDKTEIGNINKLVATADVLDTPLTKKIKQFSKIILYAVLGTVFIILILGFLSGYSLDDMALTVVSMAIALIPASLPAIVTVTLAIGVTRMAKKNAMIRKLPAVETLGSTTIICSDKTGTLTQNKMTVQEIIGENKEEILTAGLLCNDSTETTGDPTESALIISVKKSGLNPETINKKYPRLDEIPFESENMFMATLHPGIIYIKGSIESILPRCKNIDVETIQSQVDKMAEKGLRVLAFASKKVSSDKKNIDIKDISNLNFLGLQGMIDPPRKETERAIKECFEAGIQVKMITGDHIKTAAAIAKQIIKAWAPKNFKLKAINGQDLTKLKGKDLINTANQTNVFARVAPEQKLDLVKALQSQDNVVAMTGDGVNDAPALRQADIGIAMGITGTEVSKEAADMVLADDNFSTIIHAVEEGRRVYDNIIKSIVWMLPTNIAEAGVILFAIIFGWTIPVLPMQILWVNTITGGLLGAMLIFEPEEPGTMNKKPRDPKESILPKYLIFRVFLVGALLIVGTFLVFNRYIFNSENIDAARTAAVNAIVFGELFYLFNCRSLKYRMKKIGFFSNWRLLIGVGIMIVLQLIFTYAGFMNKIFGTAPINFLSWILILCVSFSIFFIIELVKWMRHRNNNNNLK